LGRQQVRTTMITSGEHAVFDLGDVVIA